MIFEDTTATPSTLRTNLTDISQLDLSKLYTYEEYYTWQFPERIELIDGVPYQLMSAPRTNHQRVSMRFSGLWGNFLDGKSCEVFRCPNRCIFSKPKRSKNQYHCSARFMHCL